MASNSKPPEIPLPKSWSKHVKSAIPRILALAQYALTYSRSWAADGTDQRVRLKADNDRLTQEVAQLRAETRIKDVRMGQLDPKRRPHYPPTERMAILELRASRGWSLEQAAKVFLADAISSWVRRIDETGVGKGAAVGTVGGQAPRGARGGRRAEETLACTDQAGGVAETGRVSEEQLGTHGLSQLPRSRVADRQRSRRARVQVPGGGSV